MTDTEILDWMERNATKLGMKCDVACGPVFDPKDDKPIFFDPNNPEIEFTDIRKRVRELATKK